MALELATGRGRTSPNPMVGACVVKDGQVVGCGFHRRAGTPRRGPCLEDAGNGQGATLYVNLGLLSAVVPDPVRAIKAGIGLL